MPICAAWRGDVALGTAHVGSPPEQIGWNSHSQLDRRAGNSAGRQLVGQVSYRVSQQDAQLVGGLSAAGDQWRDERFGLSQIRAGLGDVELGGDAVVESLLGQPQRILLDDDVSFGELQSLLERPHLHVIGRHVGERHHEHRAIILHRPVEIRVRRFDIAAQATPNVEFPGDVASRRPDVLFSTERVQGKGKVVGNLCVRVIGLQGLCLWEQIADRDASPPAHFQNAGRGGPHIEVAAIRGGDQLIQRRVIEGGPPCAVLGRVVGNMRDGSRLAGDRRFRIDLGLGIRDVDPLGRDGRQRRGIVGSYFESVVSPTVQAVNAAGRREERRHDEDVGPPRQPWANLPRAGTAASGRGVGVACLHGIAGLGVARSRATRARRRQRNLVAGRCRQRWGLWRKCLSGEGVHAWPLAVRIGASHCHCRLGKDFPKRFGQPEGDQRGSNAICSITRGSRYGGGGSAPQPEPRVFSQKSRWPIIEPHGPQEPQVRLFRYNVQIGYERSFHFSGIRHRRH